MPRAGLFVIASVALALACTKPNPRYCDSQIHCTGGKVCNLSTNGCELPEGGADASDAADGRDASDAGETKFRCVSSDQCADGGPDGAPAVCEMEAGSCVQCLADSDCTAPASPICDLTAHTCGPCATDSQCAAKAPTGPGICMFHQDGRCATDAETIYVKSSSGCSGGGSGTRAAPYCLSQDGIDAVSTQKRLVVLRGSDPLSFWSASFSGEQVSIVGQGGASISPGSFVGIHLISGNAYIRGVTVASGSSTGVVADSGTELHMDGCIVVGNNRGGVQLSSLNFEITNTVIAMNKGGTDSGGVTWGGVRISAMGPVPNTTRFLNNTVVQNGAVGISCATDVPVSGSILYGNVTGDSAGCTITACCSGDPMLTADYQLMSTSTACIDQLAPAMSTAHDIDGQLRPRGASGKSDCGADEF
jgi:hypothetical protein